VPGTASLARARRSRYGASMSKVRAGGWAAVALVLAGGVGSLVTIAAPIGFNDDPLPSYRLTGWSAPPLTGVLAALSIAFLTAGVSYLRFGVLGPRLKGLTIPMIVGALAAIGITYLSLGGHNSDSYSQWGLGLLLLSTILGATGYVLCARTGQEGESGVSRWRSVSISAVAIVVVALAVAVAVPNFTTHPVGDPIPRVEAPQAH
jgi:hypothetical protein